MTLENIIKFIEKDNNHYFIKYQVIEYNTKIEYIYNMLLNILMGWEKIEVFIFGIKKRDNKYSKYEKRNGV